MIPLRDTIPSRTVPFVTTLLIVANVLFFGVELLQGSRLPHFLQAWAFVPARVFGPWGQPEGAFLTGLVTLVSSQFLHGGFLHLAGNMLYLWIFGDNVEDALGHGRFLVFYLASGSAAALLQGIASPASVVPLLGASGAIAGVLGAYFVLYPHARVVTLIPLFILFPLVEIPAGLYLLFWFLLQFWMGSASLLGGEQGAAGGVAWWAHVGGFVTGILLVFVMRPARRPPPRVRAA